MISIWMPLNKDERNIGLGQIKTETNGAVITDEGDKKCYYFDGNDDFVSLSGQCLYDIIKGGNVPFSICFFVYHADATRAILFGDYNLTGSISVNVELFANHTLRLYWGGSPDITVSSCVLNQNEWTHIGIVYDGTKLKFYKNGDLVQTRDGALSTKTKTQGCYYLGRDQRTGTTALNGKMRDFRIYSHVLKDWEIKKLASGQMFELESNLHLEGTTNINTAPSGGLTETAYNGAIAKYGYNDASNLKKETVIIDNEKCDKVTIRSGNTAVYPYVFFQPIHPSSGQWKTVSFDYYPTTQNCLIPYTYGGNAIVNWISNYKTSGGNNTETSSRTIPVDVGKWNHIEVSLLGTTSAATGWGYFRIGSAKHTGSTSDYWLFKHVQVEESDHASPYSLVNREERFVDTSGFDNEVVPYNIVQSGPSLHFNGNDAAIKVPFPDMISGCPWTMNVWFYRPNGQFGTKSWETLFGGPSGFEISSSSSTTKTAVLCPYSWGGGAFPYEMDKWNMATLSVSSSATKVFLNGELLRTRSTNYIAPYGDYFIGAWKTYTQQNFKGYMKRFSIYQKALTEEEVKNLYYNNE